MILKSLKGSWQITMQKKFFFSLKLCRPLLENGLSMGNPIKTYTSFVQNALTVVSLATCVAMKCNFPLVCTFFPHLGLLVISITGYNSDAEAGGFQHHRLPVFTTSTTLINPKVLRLVTILLLQSPPFFPTFTSET